MVFGKADKRKRLHLLDEALAYLSILSSVRDEGRALQAQR